MFVRHWTLSADDLVFIVSRSRSHNRLGFAVQLSALRYPGRLSRPGELIPTAPLAFVAEQLQISPEVLAEYAIRGPSRYEQLGTLRDVFGFSTLTHSVRAALQDSLLPVALTTTSGAELAGCCSTSFAIAVSSFPVLARSNAWWRRLSSTRSAMLQAC